MPVRSCARASAARDLRSFTVAVARFASQSRRKSLRRRPAVFALSPRLRWPTVSRSSRSPTCHPKAATSRRCTPTGSLSSPHVRRPPAALHGAGRPQLCANQLEADAHPPLSRRLCRAARAEGEARAVRAVKQLVVLASVRVVVVLLQRPRDRARARHAGAAVRPEQRRDEGGGALLQLRRAAAARRAPRRRAVVAPLLPPRQPGRPLPRAAGAHAAVDDDVAGRRSQPRAIRRASR